MLNKTILIHRPVITVGVGSSEGRTLEGGSEQRFECCNRSSEYGNIEFAGSPDRDVDTVP